MSRAPGEDGTPRRCFLAVELDPLLTDALTALIQTLQTRVPQGGIRWVTPDALHLTLRFLGPTTTIQENALTASVADAVAAIQPFSVAVADLGCFPHMRAPRVIWVGIPRPSPPLASLQARLEQAAVACRFQPEARPFHPHLTLARVEARMRVGALRRLGAVIGRNVTGELGTLSVHSVSLMESKLLPSGARYQRLQSWPLRNGTP